MKGHTPGAFTPADFADNFHRSLDAALHREPVVVKPVTWLGESADKFCPTCGSRIVDGRGVVHPCPFGPHEEAA